MCFVFLLIQSKEQKHLHRSNKSLKKTDVRATPKKTTALGIAQRNEHVLMAEALKERKIHFLLNS